MKDVTLNQIEQARLSVLNSVLEYQVPIADAAELLGVTQRHARRMLAATLVLDYNAGNNMAITVEVALGEPRPGSPVAVPITILDIGAAASARVNIVRAVDASERELTPANIVRPEDVDAVIDKLLEWL